MLNKEIDCIFVYLGANANKRLEENVLQSASKVKFIESSVYVERACKLQLNEVHKNSIIQFDSNLGFKNGKINFTQVRDFNHLKIIDSILDDKQIPLLWTRFGYKTRLQNCSEVKRYEIAYSIIKSAIETCYFNAPKVVFFSYEPHCLPIYLFKQVCMRLGIKVITMTLSPFLWRVFVEQVNCLEGEFQKVLKTDVDSVVNNESVRRLIEEKISDYSIAKPFYEKKLSQLKLGDFLYEKFKSLKFYRYDKVIFRTIALSQYNKMSVKRSDILGFKYICFFLHLQPEQTTLPDGRMFVNQLFAIQTLYSAIAPLGIYLVIREHPATFKNSYDIKWRPRSFFNAIQNIGEHIYFDDVYADPYTLIKNSKGVASITGSVLLESLLNGIPAIAFGKHFIKDYVSKGFIDKFSDELELRHKVEEALVYPSKLTASDIKQFLYNAYSLTFGPNEYIGNENMSLEKLRQSRYESIHQILAIISKKFAMDNVANYNE